MKPIVLFAAIAGTLCYAHDVITTKITFNREIVRILNSRCVSCHRDGGTAFSLRTYQEARPWAKAIEEETLRRRMPPWGAVKGFGEFRNDQGLTMEQLELIVDWAEGGAPEGEEKDLPKDRPALPSPAAKPSLSNAIVVSGVTKLTKAIRLNGLWPQAAKNGDSFQVAAELPDGSVTPLLWLLEYKKAYEHPFLLRSPLPLPAGTVLRGVPPDARVALLPVSASAAEPRGPVSGTH